MFIPFKSIKRNDRAPIFIGKIEKSVEKVNFKSNWLGQSFKTLCNIFVIGYTLRSSRNISNSIFFLSQSTSAYRQIAELQSQRLFNIHYHLSYIREKKKFKKEILKTFQMAKVNDILTQYIELFFVMGLIPAHSIQTFKYLKQTFKLLLSTCHFMMIFVSLCVTALLCWNYYRPDKTYKSPSPPICLQMWTYILSFRIFAKYQTSLSALLSNTEVLISKSKSSTRNINYCVKLFLIFNHATTIFCIFYNYEVLKILYWLCTHISLEFVPSNLFLLRLITFKLVLCLPTIVTTPFICFSIRVLAFPILIYKLQTDFLSKKANQLRTIKSSLRATKLFRQTLIYQLTCQETFEIITKIYSPFVLRLVVAHFYRCLSCFHGLFFSGRLLGEDALNCMDAILIAVLIGINIAFSLHARKTVSRIYIWLWSILDNYSIWWNVAKKIDLRAYLWRGENDSTFCLLLLLWMVF